MRRGGNIERAPGLVDEQIVPTTSGAWTPA